MARRQRDAPERSSYILFALSGFAPELQRLAAQPGERIYLVGGGDMLPQRG